MTPCSASWVFDDNDNGIEPDPDPVSIVSGIAESSLESNDFDGTADWEKGVVVEVCAADVLAEPLTPLEKTW